LRTSKIYNYTPLNVLHTPHTHTTHTLHTDTTHTPHKHYTQTPHTHHTHRPHTHTTHTPHTPHTHTTHVVIMTSLGVQGAFDAAWWPAILNNLRNLQCPINLYNLTRSHFSERVAILCANTYRKERKVTKGSPQGSCCGPGLWDVLYNALLDLEFTSHTKAIAFADDLAILTYGETTSEAEAYTNSDLAKIENWAKQNKMQFNELKSKTMLIARKRKRNREDINIYLNNRLEQVKEMKYLGIYFDNRLIFHKHTEHITGKSRKMIYMLGKTAKLNWGLGHKSLKTIYEGALVSLMTYGAPVWEEAVKKQTPSEDAEDPKTD